PAHGGELRVHHVEAGAAGVGGKDDVLRVDPARQRRRPVEGGRAGQDVVGHHQVDGLQRVGAADGEPARVDDGVVEDLGPLHLGVGEAGGAVVGIPVAHDHGAAGGVLDVVIEDQVVHLVDADAAA